MHASPTNPASPRTAAPHSAPDTRTVTTRRVCCDGGEGALGHPRVWLSIPDASGWIDCPYCDRRFVLDPAHAGDDH